MHKRQDICITPWRPGDHAITSDAHGYYHGVEHTRASSVAPPLSRLPVLRADAAHAEAVEAACLTLALQPKILFHFQARSSHYHCTNISFTDIAGARVS